MVIGYKKELKKIDPFARNQGLFFSVFPKKMPCFHPLSAYKLINKKTDNGKSVIVFHTKAVNNKPYEKIKLPCSQCIGCRIERSKQWALRCVHEASLFENNCFITLTFSEENLNDRRSLVKGDFQKFMKRLRKHHSGIESVCSTSGKVTYPIRYFQCGEYGESLDRPHHHACLFNFDFIDKELWSIRSGVRLYRSKALEKLWPFGFSTIGKVTFQSAAYIARYLTKKVNGKLAESHYTEVHRGTGEITRKQPEYITMSRRPGIAKRWFDLFGSDVYPKDFITHQGKKFRPPKYYDNIYDIAEPEKFAKIKKKRLIEMQKHTDNNTYERLRVREKVLLSKTKRLTREFEK